MKFWISCLLAAGVALAGCSSGDAEPSEPVGAAEDLAAGEETSSVSAPDPVEPDRSGKGSLDTTDVAYQPAPSGRIVDCLIVTNGDDYEGPCRFFADSDGSFSLSLDDESPIVDRITMVSVSIVEPGQAEVRGLTTDGINSRWGPAVRDAEDRACWNGSDFTICAY